MAKKAKAKKAAPRRKVVRKPARKASKAAARRKSAPRKAPAKKTRKAPARKARKPAAAAAKKRSVSKAAKAPSQANQGEGNKTADRSYREAATRFSHSHDTAAMAERAAREVEGAPEEYQEAVEAGRSPSAGELPQDEN
jgi:hypothetical protein